MKELTNNNAEQCASFTATVYALVPEGRSSAVSISDIFANFPRGSTVHSTVRAALERLAKAGLVIKTRSPSGAGGGYRLLFHREGEVLSADELAARLRPPRPRRPKRWTPSSSGKFCPQVVMRISPWRVDKLGNLWRTVRGVAAR